jgi:hypothetical protein
VKERVVLLKKFFDELMKENSRRAVRGDPPLGCEAARCRWGRVVAATYPQLSVMGVGGGQMVVFGTGAAAAAGNKGNGGGGQPGAGAAAGSGSGGVSGGTQRQGMSQRTPARFNGIPVCFGYNSKAGCRRAPAGAKFCQEGNSRFAHVCSLFVKGVGGKPDGHCLGQHSRATAH